MTREHIFEMHIDYWLWPTNDGSGKFKGWTLSDSVGVLYWRQEISEMVKLVHPEDRIKIVTK